LKDTPRLGAVHLWVSTPQKRRAPGWCGSGSTYMFWEVIGPVDGFER
jgi:hypothetical protein